jgi:hypothetical protein
MSMVAINWNPGSVEMKKFGVSTLIGMALIGAFMYWIKEWHTVAYVFWALGGVTGLACMTGTAIGKPFYLLFMALGFVMGNVVSRVLLAGVYLFLITPMRILQTIVGRDKLQLKKPAGDSYWQDVNYSGDKKRYMRQF